MWFVLSAARNASLRGACHLPCGVLSFRGGRGLQSLSGLLAIRRQFVCWLGA